MKRAWKYGVTGITALLSVGGWLALRAPTPPSPEAPAITSTDQRTRTEAAHQTTVDVGRAPTPATADAGYRHYLALGKTLGERPASLHGTQVDGRLQVDATGHLRVTVGVRQVFDYFLSTLGEESLDAIKGRIALYLHQQLPPSAAREGWQLLNRYLDYRRRLAGLEEPTVQASTERLRQTIEARQRLRTAALGPTVSAAFFGPEAAYDDYALKRLAIQRNDHLGADEKRRRLHQLTASLPEPVQRMRTQTRAPARAAQRVEALRRQGASDARVQAYRSRVFGPEAATRLKHLDAQRAAWQARYQRYRDQRAAIADAGLSADDKARQIRQLRQRLFEANELKRVAALDRIADLEPDPETTAQ